MGTEGKEESSCSCPAVIKQQSSSFFANGKYSVIEDHHPTPPSSSSCVTRSSSGRVSWGPSMTQKGPDFDLPDNILALIPADPYEQLDLSRRIASMAITSRVSRLEGEAGRLRQKIADKDQVIEDLRDKLSHLDRLVQETQSRLMETVSENAVLSRERDTLTTTSKKLARDLSKLEMFKKHLMRSLGDDNSSSEAVDTRTYKQPIARLSSWSDDGSTGHTGFDVSHGSAETGDSTQDGPEHAVHQFTITPYTNTGLTPVGTPKVSSSGGSSPRVMSGVTSPAKSRSEEYGSLSPWYASSQHSSASSSPPHTKSLSGRAPLLAGKELFRQARNRLSYEQFAAFLANVKEFNAKRQSREDTLAKAEGIFSTENKDLYLSFQSLLKRTPH